MLSEIAAPDPCEVRSPREFVGSLKQLKAWADLTYRQLERRSARDGEVLPRSTIAAVLSRATLPRHEFVVAMVRACGQDPRPWVRARRRLALSSCDAEAPGVAPRDGSAGRSTLDRAARCSLPPDFALAGRELEQRGLVRLLGGQGDGPANTVVVSGPPGVGKSMLAVRVAHECAQLFPDGQLYIDLRGADPHRRPLTPEEVTGRLLEGLGAPDAADAEDGPARVQAAIAGRRLLVILDNARSVEQVRSVVPTGGGATVLITSRAGLTSLNGALQFYIEALSRCSAIDVLTQFLGCQRLTAEPEAVDRLVELCDYLPLGLRIVAARLAARPRWPVAALVERLADEHRRLDELRVDDLDMRDCLMASLLTVREREPAGSQTALQALRLLGRIPATDIDCRLVATALDVSDEEAEYALERLVDARLLETSAPNRYRMSSLVRLFAREQDSARSVERAKPVDRAPARRRLGLALERQL